MQNIDKKYLIINALPLFLFHNFRSKNVFVKVVLNIWTVVCVWTLNIFEIRHTNKSRNMIFFRGYFTVRFLRYFQYIHGFTMPYLSNYRTIKIFLVPVFCKLFLISNFITFLDDCRVFHMGVLNFFR